MSGMISRKALSRTPWLLSLASPLFMLHLGSGEAVAQQVRANGIVVDTETDEQDPADLAPLLAQAREVRLVHLTGDPPDQTELFHRARLRLIQLLHQDAGFDVLVLPVGIYEGVWTDRRLLDDSVAGRKLIYWEGRGASEDPLQTAEPVLQIELNLGS